MGNIGRLDGTSEDESSPVRTIQCDENFLSAYGLSLAVGRNFTTDKIEEWRSSMVNESAVKLLGFSAPDQILGHKVLVWGDALRIVGVVKDYHHESLKRQVDQLIFICDHEVTDYFSIRFTGNTDIQQLVSTAASAFGEAFPDNTFHYFFMDDYFEKQYEHDVTFNKLTGVFAILATLISCLGLFGLSSYLLMQRAKEIGIRKVLGAKVAQIVVIANFIVLPIGYYWVHGWLNDFAYQMKLGAWMFVVPGGCAVLIALATVAVQSVKAFIKNPVECLRNQ